MWWSRQLQLRQDFARGCSWYFSIEKNCFTGQCECYKEFSGKTCECSTLQTNCIAPDSNVTCSGFGTCDCNECQCDSSHFGKFCESSPGNEGLNSLCIFYEPCVQCVINRKLERECSDYQEKCTSKSGNLYKSEFYDDISGETSACACEHILGIFKIFLVPMQNV